MELSRMKTENERMAYRLLSDAVGKEVIFMLKDNGYSRKQD
jgi:hypothetical protein